MCGFIGSISLEKINNEKLQECNNKIICRGPDSTKQHHSKVENFEVDLIFNRLSIIDLSKNANQPMEKSDSNFILLFNGEIYNSNELRNNLKHKGYDFETSHSDTESLFNTILEYKIKAPNYLRGQFAFVFVDKINRKIYLCRDRIGQKPLYYYFDEKKLNFSSNLISLSKFNNFKNVNFDSIESYLSYGRATESSTIYQNILELEPGTILEIDVSQNKLSKRLIKYWELESFYDNKKFDEEEFYSIFQDSVSIRTNSDVPYATFLSGGLDSSSIVKSQNEDGNIVNTFSVYMDNKQFDESYYCKMVAEKYNTNHSSVLIKDFISIENYENIIKTLDEPFADPSYLPTYIISEAISSKYKVAISGDGGDELLGGYLRVKNSLFVNSTNNIADKVFKIYPPFLGTGNMIISKSNDLSTRYNSYLSDLKLLQLLDLRPQKNIFNKPSSNTFEDYKQLMMNEYSFYLPKLMMYKVDRSSMANSLEVRSPYVDNKLIEYIFSHSFEYFDNVIQKKLLNQYLRSDFPDKFFKRNKQGFVFDNFKFVYGNQDYFKDKLKILNKKLNIDTSKLDLLFTFRTRINADRIFKLSNLSNYLEINNL